jgi:hypothetical protein
MSFELPDSRTARESATSQTMVTGLWIGNHLPLLARLCIRSFQSHGYRFRLFSYGDIAGIPPGTLMEDAGEILPSKELFFHSETGSLAHAADWFRYRFLAVEGGLWTDMDMVCLKPEIPSISPWFALQDTGSAAIGFLSFPKGHVIPSLLAEFAADPATPMPWDAIRDIEQKIALRRAKPDVFQRRAQARWAATGPIEFTKALRHFKLWESAASWRSIYPVHYSRWRHCFDGTLTTSDPLLADAWGIHLWGELLRREPDALQNMRPTSIVASLLKSHCIEPCEETAEENAAPTAEARAKILVGICSGVSYTERRQGVRDSWMKEPENGIECRFFVGGGTPLVSEPDVTVLNVPDTYEHLPEKVLAFFKEALRTSQFDYLFKCDDDTYVALDRLRELVNPAFDLVGNEFIHDRGSPSGGAGYLLSRRIVELLCAENGLEAVGAEDVIIGKAAIRLGAAATGTNRLCWNESRFPQPGNDVVTSHWCSPGKLRVIAAELRGAPRRTVQVVHPHWKDTLFLFSTGVFRRMSAGCSGRYESLPDGRISLKWFSWPPEILTPVGDIYRASPLAESLS